MSKCLASVCRAWALIIVFSALVAGVANQAPAQIQSSQDIGAQVNALLGAHDNIASPAQWRSLGDAAIPTLESVVADSTSLPTRRARALDGLAALSSGKSTMQRVANSGSEPLIVRISGVRGLAQVLPDSDLIPALQPLLNDAQWQLRGAVAQTLSNTPAGCAAIKDTAQREAPEWRSRFVSACKDQTNSAIQLPTGKTVVDTSISLLPINIVDPSGTTVFNYFNYYAHTNLAKIDISGGQAGVSVLLPNSPTLPFGSGSWAFTFFACCQPTTVDVNAFIKTAPAPALTTGKLDANVFFVGVPGLNARSASTDTNFQTVLTRVRSIYAQIGVELGHLTYIDITGADAVTFADVQEQDLGALFMLSNHPAARDGAVNIFLVDSIVSPFFGGILGESAGIPGIPIRGTPGSGLAVTMADFPSGLDVIAATIAHETGHWLGLFHPTEIGGFDFDPLPDTPECPTLNFFNYSQCPDSTNLMFPIEVPLAGLPALTPNQQFVVLRNPVVSQPPQSGVQLHSIALGSIPVVSPFTTITADVPPDGISLDLFPVAKFTPATIRVPEDFPTIQIAVNNAHARDTIVVGPGSWCGARITKPLNLIGQGGATIVGCPAGNPGPVGNPRRRGFRIEAAGTSIRNFVFDGRGVSDANLNPLFFGIETVSGADNLVIDSNTFQGTAYGVLLSGENSQVTHNIFDGFTIRTSNGDGGVAIFEADFTRRLRGNSILYNQITSTVPAGDLSGFSWTNEADVTLAGIVVSGQDGTIISHNTISITANSHGDGGVGILATDAVTGIRTTDLTITNNDGRGSAYGLIITNDLGGGTGNSVGAQIRGNFGINLINGATANVGSRSTLLLCDPVTGACP